MKTSIFIVDDEDNILNIIETILANEGYEASRALVRRKVSVLCTHGAQRFPPHEMHMNMEYLLAAIRIRVEYQSEPALVESGQTGDFG